MKNRIILVLLALFLPFAMAGGEKKGQSRQEPLSVRDLPADDYFAAWKQSLEDIGQPSDFYQPYIYYVDDFGAFYYDEEFNRIYPGAADPAETSGSGLGFRRPPVPEDDDSGGGGGGGGGSSGPGCWQFTFSQIGAYFPNPSGSGTNIKARINLLVLGTDFNFYNSSLSTKVFNILGQTVYSKSLGSFAPSPSFDVISWNGKNNSGNSVASGIYTIRLTASSSLCGTKSFSGGVTIIN